MVQDYESDHKAADLATCDAESHKAHSWKSGVMGVGSGVVVACHRNLLRPLKPPKLLNRPIPKLQKDINPWTQTLWIAEWSWCSRVP